MKRGVTLTARDVETLTQRLRMAATTQGMPRRASEHIRLAQCCLSKAARRAERTPRQSDLLKDGRIIDEILSE